MREEIRYLYDDRAVDNVVKAHIIAYLPNPERQDDRLIVYRWYGTHIRKWWYGVTSERIQDLIWKDYVQKVLELRKAERKSNNKNK